MGSLESETYMLHSKCEKLSVLKVSPSPNVVAVVL